MWYMHDVGWGWWLLMSLGMVAVWALVLYGLIWLVRGQAPRRADADPAPSPDELLKRRLAAGEIDLDEYERVRRALEDGAGQREPVAQ